MNEVTQIHLGRQPFTVSVEAHSSLKSYLAAITKQVEDKSVVEEVELRMAELLTEHGISGDKVVLQSDVDFLKEQLGNPKDFKESDEEPSREEEPAESSPKRLFRNTDSAMIAGVASGLSSYFGVDVVFIRIIFVIAVITGGWGILLYLALWLLVPEAKTSSERLQMQGKPVTVEALKNAVERADVKGAASRVNTRVVPMINYVFKQVLKFFGLIFVLGGLTLILGLLTSGTYLGLNYGRFTHENIFPVGTTEHLLLYLAFALAAFMGLFVTLFGLAMFRRKWPVRAWVTGTLVGVFMIGLATSAALAADAFPRVRNRYNAAIHTTVRELPPFTKAYANGEGFVVEYERANKYGVTLEYLGNADVSNIKTEVKDGVLEINGLDFKHEKDCNIFCGLTTRVIIASPNPLADITHPDVENVHDSPDVE